MVSRQERRDRAAGPSGGWAILCGFHEIPYLCARILDSYEENMSFVFLFVMRAHSMGRGENVSDTLKIRAVLWCSTLIFCLWGWHPILATASFPAALLLN